jgi:quercetin dioxygenase-like cupin family protein
MHSAWRLALLLSGALLLVLISGGGTVAAQEPPLPTNRIVSRFPVTTSPAQYELVQITLDFSPGSATPLHRHGGPAYVTVIEGQVARTEDGLKTVYSVGQTFTEPEMKPHVVANESPSKARVLASILLSPGEQPTVDDPNAPMPASLPSTTFLSRTTVGTQPGEFELTHVVVDFGAGAFLPMHTHGGPGLVTVASGQIEFGKASGSQRLGPGGLFLDVSDPHTARNVASSASTAYVTFLIRKGAAITTFVNQPTGSPIVTPPNTGDGGILTGGSPDTTFVGLTIAIVSTLIAARIAVLRRRHST